MPDPRTHQRSAGSIRTLLLLLIGTAAVGLAWLLTPRYGPWPCHGVAAPIAVLSAAYLRPKAAQVPHSGVTLVGSLMLGILLAVASWSLAPVAAMWIPPLSKELHSLYATLYRTPGPLRAAPILALTVLAEELIWRGAIVDWLLSKNLSATRVTLLATAAYALPMVCSGSWLLIAVALMLGTTLTIQRLYLRSWLPCFVTHLTWNVLIFVVHPVL